MQILESSMLGLRAARLVMRHPNQLATVTLLPVVHVGDASFYDTTYADALAHDVVLFEGIRSRVSRRLTRAYRWIDVARLGLVIQPRLEKPGNSETRIVHADLSPAEFATEWRKIPFLLRLTFSVLAPLFGLRQRVFATRESIAYRTSLEDHKTPEEIMSWSPGMDPFWHALLTARDARLIDRLRTELGAGGRPLRIAIIFGAQHIRAISAELSRTGFHCSSSEWREVIALD